MALQRNNQLFMREPKQISTQVKYLPLLSLSAWASLNQQPFLLYSISLKKHHYQVIISPFRPEYRSSIMSDKNAAKTDAPKWGESTPSHSTLDQLHWLGDKVVPNTHMLGAPCAVASDESLYVFYQKYAQNDPNLYYDVFDGSKWWGTTMVPSTEVTDTPSAVVFDGNIYVFHASPSDDRLWYNVFDGSEWWGDQPVPDSRLAFGPSAVVFGDNIYVFYQGPFETQSLFFNVFDGSRWWGDQPVPRTTKNFGAPGAAYVPYDGTIYVFYEGDHSQILYNVYDGTSWYGDRQIADADISFSPNAAAYGNKVFCFHLNRDLDSKLYYSAYNGKYWEHDIWVAHMGLNWTPSCAVFQDKLYVCHQGDGNVLMYNALVGGEE